jgi:hypothetical protein
MIGDDVSRVPTGVWPAEARPGCSLELCCFKVKL